MKVTLKNLLGSHHYWTNKKKTMINFLNIMFKPSSSFRIGLVLVSFVKIIICCLEIL